MRESLVAGHACRPQRDRGVGTLDGSPASPHPLTEGCETGLVGPAPRMVGVFAKSSHGAVDDDAVRPVRMRGSEHRCQRATFGDAEDRGSFGAHRVEDGKDIVYPLLERRRRSRPATVRYPTAPPVEQDEATEL